MLPRPQPRTGAGAASHRRRNERRFRRYSRRPVRWLGKSILNASPSTFGTYTITSSHPLLKPGSKDRSRLHLLDPGVLSPPLQRTAAPNLDQLKISTWNCRSRVMEKCSRLMPGVPGCPSTTSQTPGSVPNSQPRLGSLGSLSRWSRIRWPSLDAASGDGGRAGVGSCTKSPVSARKKWTFAGRAKAPLARSPRSQAVKTAKRLGSYMSTSQLLDLGRWRKEDDGEMKTERTSELAVSSPSHPDVARNGPTCGNGPVWTRSRIGARPAYLARCGLWSLISFLRRSGR